MYFHLQDLPSVSTSFFIKLSPLYPSRVLIFAPQQCCGVNSLSFPLTPTTLFSVCHLVCSPPMFRWIPCSAGFPFGLFHFGLHSFIFVSSASGHQVAS